jgi:tryptophan-rich sensory protein
MPIRLPMLTDPLLWVFLAAVFFGAAVSRATRRTANRPDPERARTRKWVLFCVWLSLAVLAAVGAVLVPGSERLVRRVGGTLHLVEPLVPWVALAGFAIAFLATRFRKSLGIPVIVLGLVAVIALGLFFQSVRAFTGKTEIATVKAITVADGKMRLEVQPAGRASAMVDLDGDQFAPEVRVVIFDDLWVFLGAKTWYRFVGLQSFETRNGRSIQSPTMWTLERPTGISESLWIWFERNEERIPGVRTAQTELVLKKARSLGSWSVKVQNDGGVEVVPLSD